MSAEAAAPLVNRNAKGQPATPADARELAKRPRRRRYLPHNIECAADFAPHNRRRIDWTRRRMKELTDLTGEVSHGVGAMVACAGWLYAGGEWACERAASTGDLDLFKTAAALTATARTHDMGAWEIAVREADARAESKKKTGAAPWFVSDGGKT
ncbi:MAG: hypothetical protein U0270_41185 [Labilithrix sp.]